MRSAGGICWPSCASWMRRMLSRRGAGKATPALAALTASAIDAPRVSALAARVAAARACSDAWRGLPVAHHGGAHLGERRRRGGRDLVDPDQHEAVVAAERLDHRIVALRRARSRREEPAQARAGT